MTADAPSPERRRMLPQASPITQEVITARGYRTGTSKKQRSARSRHPLPGSRFKSTKHRVSISSEPPLRRIELPSGATTNSIR